MRKIIALLLLMLILGGCSCSNSNYDSEGGNVEASDGDLHSKVFVDLNLLNEQTDEYYLFLVKPGTIGQDGAATRIFDFKGPIEVENFEAEIDLEDYSLGIELLLEELEEKKLQLVVTTREDFLIRNPLNEETFIYFEEVGEVFKTHKATQGNFEIDIIDKYPDGVLSLPFPDADFVVKLKFKEGITPRSSYGVRIREFSDRTDSGLGLLVKGSPLSNEGNYYNAVFYSEYLKGFAGVLEIEGQQPQTVRYEGEPLTLRFDEEGQHIGDDVIEVYIIEGE